MRSPEVYTHGHHQSVLDSHSRRTAVNSAAYLLGHLRPGQNLIDIGSGPGTITLDLAGLVAPGRVVGIDASADVVAKAEQLRQERGVANVEFRVGDVYRLDVAPESFDVAHAHQVLQHLADPVAALAGLKEVLVPGGLVAVRDGDYGGFVWGPDSAAIERWMDLYHQVTARNGGQADAGRYLLGWVQRAGFVDAVATSSTWTFADPEARTWWAETWAQRVEHSAFAEQAVTYGLADRAELAALAEGWRSWSRQPDGFFAVLHGEVVARRPAG